MAGKQKKQEAAGQAKTQEKTRQSAQTGFGDKKTEGPDRPST
ncbi:hypothetical protein [Alteribacter lacisalsi]|nr:hypothetical protein [Alteribacter lacisalsi]